MMIIIDSILFLTAVSRLIINSYQKIVIEKFAEAFEHVNGLKKEEHLPAAFKFINSLLIDNCSYKQAKYQ